MNRFTVLRAVLCLALSFCGQFVFDDRAEAEAGAPSCGPAFSQTGPDAEAYGAVQNYPLGTIMDRTRQAYMVATFSNYDKLLPAHDVMPPAAPSPLARNCDPFSFSYMFEDSRRTIEDYLSRHPATEVEDEFRARLAVGRERDRAAARALEGPHLSDLIVTHGPKNAPAPLCSSGEQKALLIGLILAKAELIKEIEGASPLILLDELAAHLDLARREALFAEISRLSAQAWLRAI